MVVVSVMVMFLRGDDLVKVVVVVAFSIEDLRLLEAERSSVSSRKSDESPEEETWCLWKLSKNEHMYSIKRKFIW